MLDESESGQKVLKKVLQSYDYFNPAKRQIFANALGKTHNLILEPCLYAYLNFLTTRASCLIREYFSHQTWGWG